MAHVRAPFFFILTLSILSAGWSTVTFADSGRSSQIQTIAKGIDQATLLIDRQDSGAGGVPQIYYYALAPNEKVAITLTGYANVQTIPMPSQPVKQDHMPFDTLFRPADQVPMSSTDFPSAPALSITGYGWFRGYYVARISVQPCFVPTGNSSLQFASKIRVTVQKSGGTENSSVRPLKKSDPQYETLLRELILNYETAIPYRMVNVLDASASWFTPSATYLKLAIPKDGNYRLTKAQIDSILPAMGHANPRTFQMFNRGAEIPIYVAGEGDGSFDAGDYIEFPGQQNYTNAHRIITSSGEYNEYLNRYTDTSCYWLTYGIQTGLRCDSNAALAAPPDTLRTYTAFLHFENSTMLSASQVDQTTVQEYHWNYYDLWPWGYIGATGTASSGTFNVSNIASGGDSVTVYAKLSGWGSDVTVAPPVHNIAIRLNSTTDLANVLMSKGQQVVLKGKAPVTSLSETLNSISIYSYPTASTSVNWVLYDWFEIEYPRQLVAVNDSLLFDFRTLPDRKLRAVQITGLTTKNISLYRVLPSPKRISSAVFSTTALYTLTFTDTIGPNDQYILSAASKLLIPQVKNVKQFKNLRATSKQVDYLAITHKLFAPEAQQYCNFVSSAKNLSTMLVDVGDIFDEYGFGYPTAESIRDFVRSTAQWTTPMPSYLFLIGDASYDYKFYYKQYSAINYVPSLGVPVSDVALTVVDSVLDLPQLYVGRLPVNAVGEITAYLATISNYTNAPYDDWNKRYLFFTGGDPDVLGQIESFKATNDAIINIDVTARPIGGLATHFYKTKSPQSDFGPYTIQQVHDAINNGAVFISYIGHSGTQTWDNSIGDASQLQNAKGRFTLVSDFGCSTAKFAEPLIKSFSELFVLGNSASAIGYIGNSSLGFTTIASNLPPAFYSTILHDSVTRIGKAHMLAKLRLYPRNGASQIDDIMLFSNTLIGDPSADLAVPFKPHFVVSSGDLILPTQPPTDQQDSVGVKIVWHNFGSVTSDSVTIQSDQSYKGTMLRTERFRRPMPFYGDTLQFYMATKGKTGSHTLTVSIDPEQLIQQISRQHNTVSRNIQVASTELLLLEPQPMLHAAPSTFTFLNPENISLDSVATVDLELDSLDTFLSPVKYSQPLGRIVTSFDVRILPAPAHYYWRARIRGSNSDWTIGDVFFGTATDPQFGQSDAFSWSSDQFSSTGYTAEFGVTLQKKKISLHLISSGFLTGAFGVVELNGANVLPSTTNRGHSIVVFDTVTFAVLQQRTFDLFGNAAQADSLIAFIQNVPAGALVAALIVDEGANNFTTAARNAYKLIGSALSDKVEYRDSWAIIGKKGAAPGTALEGYKASTTGRVILDTAFYRTESYGTVATPSFGPASRWKSLVLSKETPQSARLQTSVIGFSARGTADSLIVSDTAATINLSGISPRSYRSLNLKFSYFANAALLPPMLHSWSLAFDQPAELVTSAKLIRLSKTKVNEGENLDITAVIVNGGQHRADSVHINLLSNDKGSDQILASYVIDSIPARDSAAITYRYNSRGRSGIHQFTVDVDPDTLQTEFFRTNNQAAVSYTVIPDTLKPVLPNLVLKPDFITIPSGIITDDRDSIPVRVGILNIGSATNDSIEISARHEYGSSVVELWYLRVPMPLQSDTITFYPHVKNRAGDHLISVTVDSANKVIESSKTDNTASKLFTVATTTFRILQPLPMNASSVQQLILLNPSSETPDGKKSIQIQIDTTNLFTTVSTMSAVMQEFTTSFPIGSLQRPARYWWRAKILGGSSDWTVGTFYLGDSTTSQLGQIDSTGWASNQFVHASFSPATGVQIQNTPGDVRTVSAGYLDGNFASVALNGSALFTTLGDTCHLLITLDSNFSVKTIRRFHIFSNPADADSLAGFLQQIPPGTILAATISGEGSQNLTAAVRTLYKSLGSTLIDRVAWRDGWSLITRRASGAVAEAYAASGSGKAIADTVFYKIENTGSVTTAIIGPASQWGLLKLKATIPTGSQLTTAVLPLPPATDTLLVGKNGTSLDLQSISTRQYPLVRLSFRLQASPSGISPAIKEWTIGSRTSCELVLSVSKVTLDKPLMQEGEICTLQAKILNVAGVAADTVRVTISTDDAGPLRIIQDITLLQIRGLDSAVVSIQYDSRGRHGSHSFVLRVDPDNRIPEFDKSNNSCTVPYAVIGDTIRPTLDVTYDGTRVLDGDYISARPVITFRMHDNNPTPMALRDTANFTIRLDNQHIYFTPGDPIEFSPSGPSVRWNPPLPDGEHKFQYFAQDIAGNSTDTTLLYLNVSSAYKLLDVFPIPNPFVGGTHFSFTLLGASAPSSVRIKIFTIAGRAIRDLQVPASDVRIGYNKVFWDGRDQDGSEIGNGIYLFRMMLEGEGGKLAVTGKLMKMR